MANETVLFKRGDSATITSTPVTDGQILFDTSGNGKMYLDNGTDRLEMGGAITVDASLSKTSTNAIQNKAVTGNILNSLAEVSAATQQNTIAGALALKEVNSSLANVSDILKWNKIATVTGGTTINLPDNYNEIFVILKLDNNDEVNFTYFASKDMLTENFNEFRLGYYSAPSNYATGNVAISLTQAYIANAVLVGNNKLSTSTLTVYYR